MNLFLRLALNTLVFVLVTSPCLSGQGQGAQGGQREAEEWALTFEYLSKPIRSDKPKAGYVPDSKTAISIAEAIARVVYGDANISLQRPFRARLKEGIWTVMGTLNPPGALGGVAIIQLRKSNGEVILATHTY